MASSPQDQKSSGLFQSASKSSKSDTRSAASGQSVDARLPPVGSSTHGNLAGASQLGGTAHSTTSEDSYMGSFGINLNGKPSSPHATLSAGSVSNNYTPRPSHFAFPQPGSPTGFSSAAPGAHLLSNPSRPSGYPHQLQHNTGFSFGQGPSSINPPRDIGLYQQTGSQHSFSLPSSSKEPMSRLHGFGAGITPAHSTAKSSGSSISSPRSSEQHVSSNKNDIKNGGNNHAQRPSVGPSRPGQSRRSPILGEVDRETREKEHKEKEKITRSHIEVLNRPAYRSTPSSSPPVHANSPKDTLIPPASSSQLPSTLPSQSSRSSAALAPSSRPQSGGDRREVIRLNVGSESNDIQAAGQPILERREPRPYGFSFHNPSAINPAGPSPGDGGFPGHKRSGGVKSASGSPVRAEYASHPEAASLPSPAMPAVVPVPVSRKYGLGHATSSLPPAPSSGGLSAHSQSGYQHRHPSGTGGMKDIEPLNISPGLSNLSQQSSLSHSHQHTHRSHSHPLPLPPQHQYQHQHQPMTSSTLLPPPPPPPPPPAPPPSTILSGSNNSTSASRKLKSHRYAVPTSIPSATATSSLLRPEFNPTLLSSAPNPTVRSPFLSSLPREVPYLGKFIYGGQGWILPCEVGEKAHELMRVPVGGGPARSARGGPGGGGRVEVVIPSGFLGTGWTLKHEMGGAGNSVDGSSVFENDGWNALIDSIGKERSLWGTEVYTDDSDIVALLVHAGWIVPAPESIEGNSKSDGVRERTEAEAEAEADIQERERDRLGSNGNGHSSNSILWKESGALRVTLRVVGRLIRYIGTERNGVKSRGWGNGHDGGSLVVEGITRVERTNRTSSLSRRTKKARMIQAVQLRNESIKEDNSAVVNLHVWGGAGFKYSQAGIQSSFDNALYNAFASFALPTENGSLGEMPDRFDTGFKNQDLYLENPDERYRLTLSTSIEGDQPMGRISPRLSIYVLPKQSSPVHPFVIPLDPTLSATQEQAVQKDVHLLTEGESKEEEELLGGTTVGPSDLEWVEMGLVVRDSFSSSAAAAALGDSTNETGIEDQTHQEGGKDGQGVDQVRTGWFCKIESYWWAPRLSNRTE